MKDIIQNHLTFSQTRLKALIDSSAYWQKYMQEVTSIDPDVTSEFVSSTAMLARTRVKFQLHIANTQIH